MFESTASHRYNNIVHLYQATAFGIKASQYKRNEREGGKSLRAIDRVRPLDLIVHHSNNPERSIPAESRVHKVPLDDTLMVIADDFLLLELVAELGLGLGLELGVVEALPTAVICPEISIYKNVYDERFFNTLYGQD